MKDLNLNMIYICCVPIVPGERERNTREKRVWPPMVDGQWSIMNGPSSRKSQGEGAGEEGTTAITHSNCIL